MSVGLGFMIMIGGDPCGASPTISSVGTPATQLQGNCAAQELQIRTVVSLSVTLTGTGCTLQRRFYFGSSSTPSYGSWTNIATTGTSVNDDVNVGLYTTNSGAGYGSLGTYYYNVEYRIIGTDDSTVCDGPDASSQWSATIYSCMA